MSLVMPVTAEIQSSTRHVKERRGSATNTSTESQFATKMYLYGREICFLLAIIFTSYAALHNSTPKVSKSPAAVPFFRGSPHLTDYFHGQLGRAFERVAESDVSLVMYYAPWDADSQELRPHFAATAEYYHEQVHFAAINCWQPLSECRAHFAKIQTFPVLIAYVQSAKGVQYKGVREAAHMIAFLRSVLRPVERVADTAHLVDMMSRHDAVVVGFFGFRGSLGAPGWHAFHAASLRFLERDPRREVGFAAVTDERTALRWDVAATPAVRIYLWNETLEFPGGGDGALSAEAVASWASASLHQALAWIAPPGVKSLTLAPYAEEGAVLVLFTPLNPLLDADANYQALREVALEYYNCDGNQWVADLARWLPAIRQESASRLAAAHRRCETRRRAEPAADLPTVTTTARSDNASCRRRVSPGPALPCGAAFAFRDSRRLPTSMAETEDTRGAAALTASWLAAECKRLEAARKLPPPPPPPQQQAPPPDATELRGLACRTNRTLSLLAMDALQFAHFAPALGVKLSEPGAAGVAIFNAYEESSYAMSAPVGPSALAEFVVAFAAGRVDRTLRSSANSANVNRFPERADDECGHGRSVVCVPELTADTFRSVVMDSTKSVVVLYHSPFCAFCGGVSHAFLATARQFRAVPDLAFVRIDGENNDLPWELTMHHYPTIIFFPAHAKSESRVFPSSTPATSDRLGSFVLANLGAAGRLAARAGLCAAATDARAAAACVRRLRAECLDAVDAALAEHRAANAGWRAAQAAQLSRSALAAHRISLRQRSRHLLFRLQHLRQVHLLLGTTGRLAPDSATLRAVHKSFLLYRHALQAPSGRRGSDGRRDQSERTEEADGAGLGDEEAGSRRDEL